MKDENKISFWAAVLMSINIMVGAGILYAVGPMTAEAGTISFLGWPLTGLMLLPIMLGLAKASHIFPGGSGFYHYCSTGLHPIAGIIAQWGFFLGYMGTAATLSTVLREGLGKATGVTMINEYPIIFNLALVTFYTLINLISVDKISKLQSVGTLLKITPLVTVIAVMAFYIHPNLEFDLSDLRHIGLTISTVIFAYLGFEACCSIGGLLKDGPQKVGSVVLTASVITMTLYTLFHVGVLFIMGEENLATYGAMAFPKYLGLSPVLGNAMQVGIAFAILFSWANSILGVSLANISNIYTLATSKVVLGDKMLTKLNSHQRPYYAALAYAIALFVFITFIDDINILMALTNMGVITALSLTMVAVFRTLFKEGKYSQLVIPFISFGSCAAWVYYSMSKIPSLIYVLPLTIGLIAGVVMFLIQKSREAKELHPSK